MENLIVQVVVKDNSPERQREETVKKKMRKKGKLVPCPSDKCASERQGKKRPLVRLGEICDACTQYYDGSAWG